MTVLRITSDDLNQIVEKFPFTPNRFQRNLLEEIAFEGGHIVVDSVAGSGKTSSARMVVDVLLAMDYDREDILTQAFNSHIKKELDRRLPKGVQSRTSHSLGLEMCRRWLKENDIPYIGMNKNKYYDINREYYQLFAAEHDIRKYELFRTKMGDVLEKVLLNNINPNSLDAIEEIINWYNIPDIPEEFYPYVSKMVDAVVKDFQENGSLHYIDMIYMPSYLDMSPDKQYKIIIVDEAHDLNELQHNISDKMLHPEGRIIHLYDIHQSMYGFAGANVNGLDRIKKKYDSKILDLNICYRCPISHVKMVQQLVPKIEAAPHAKEGEIEYHHIDEITLRMKPGDMILSRTNRPLFSVYFEFIKKQIPVKVIGRDWGDGLISIINKATHKYVNNGTFTMENLYMCVHEYYIAERDKILKKKNHEVLLRSLREKYECITVCIQNIHCTNLDDFKKEMQKIFSDIGDKGHDRKSVVQLSTIHKAKGLEEDHVGIIDQEWLSQKGKWRQLLPYSHPNQQPWEEQQEKNIEYVAKTRAKSKITFFGGHENGRKNVL